MTLPATINALASWPAYANTAFGPFLASGNLYVPADDTTNHVVRMWKSTDGGNTWAEVDSAHHPAVQTAAATVWDGVSAAQNGTTIAVGRSTGASLFAVAPFNTSTDLWGTSTANLSAGGGMTRGTGAMACQVLIKSNGDYVLIIQAINTTFGRVRLACYSVANGVWSSLYEFSNGNTTLDTTSSTSWDYCAALVGSSDRIHIFITSSNNSTIWTKSVTFTAANPPVGTFDAGVNFGTISNTASYPTGLPVLNGTTIELPIRSTDPNTPLQMATATSGANPTWTTTTINSSASDRPETTTSNPAAIAVNGSKDYAIWVGPASMDTTLFRNKDTAAAGTWGTDDILATITAGKGICTGAGSDANHVGILYNDNGTVKYTEFDVRIPAVPSGLDATAGDGQVVITWQAPGDVGTSSLTSYTVTASPGGTRTVTPDGSTRTATITGLVNGTTYTFTVHATNTTDNSDESVASGAITPYSRVDGQALGAGFGGHSWSGTDPSSPNGFIWGYANTPGGMWDRWEKLGGYEPSLTIHNPNPPFRISTLATVSVSNTGLVLLEAQFKVIKTGISLLEALLNVIQTRTPLLEIQLRAIQTRVENTEAQLRAIQTGIERIEAPGRFLSTRSEPIEARLAVVQTRLADVEAQLRIIQTRLADVEAQLRIIQTNAALLEAPGKLYQTRLENIEAPGRFLSTRTAVLEAQLSAIQTRAVLLEAPGKLYQTGLYYIEARGIIIGSGITRLESEIYLFRLTALDAETQRRVIQAPILDMEATGRLAGSGVTRLEAVQRLLASRTVQLEDVLPLLRVAFVDLESTLALSQTTASRLEAAAGILGSGVTELEAKRAFASTRVLDVESYYTARQTGVLDAETVAALTLAALARVESTLAVSRTAMPMLEALSGLTPLARLLIEAIGITTTPVSGIALLPLESNLGLTRAALQQLEAYARINGYTALALEALLAQIVTGRLSDEASARKSNAVLVPLENNHAAVVAALQRVEAYGRIITGRTLANEALFAQALTGHLSAESTRGALHQALFFLEARGFTGQLLTVDLESGTICWTPLPVVTRDGRVLIESLNYARRARTIPVEQTPVLIAIAQALGLGIENRGTAGHFLHSGGENILIIREHGE